MELLRIVNDLAVAHPLGMQPRPYANHAVRSIPVFSPQQRAEMLEHVGLNVFFFPAEMVTGCDLLSDSGTTSMTNEQWAALHLGDEAYGSNKGFFLLMEQVRRIFGEAFFNDPASGRSNAFIFHQGRACECALFSVLARGRHGTEDPLIVPSNGHFDTTGANIEENTMEARNLPVNGKIAEVAGLFRGNMDTAALEELLDEAADRIPVVYLTVTNNVGGGLPVSMANIRDVSKAVHARGLPLFFDACRFAENAWFIQQHEASYGNRQISEIVREMFSHVDGFTISFKKDGLCNMGGGLFIRDESVFMEKYPHVPDELVNWQILREGHPTYGGMSGRDIMALIAGLQTVTIQGYLDYRIAQVQRFGRAMKSAGAPVVEPFGGHAIYIDTNAFFEGTPMRPKDYGGIALAAVLLAGYGHRACELGYFAFGKYNASTGEESFPPKNYLRFAVPRLRYERQDLDACAEAMGVLYKQRDNIPGVTVVYGRELSLRHFKARFELNRRPTL